ncbi:G protein-coupled glucose receptor regulating Gpa2-domain-containing protein [Cladorrhinum sp. PSN332]|nr:G protein-coupled glucose receptor regulating Gpa2-domain-containing protein [Cladorrhinum sp. PSN332]
MLGLLGSISLRMLQHYIFPTPSTVLYPTAPIQARSTNIPDSERSEHIIYVLSVLSLVFASMSVVSTLSTLYWFVKMRRSFRHELILLLVQSDLVKSAAFVVFPIVSMLSGPAGVRSDSAFCQVSGFALAIGIESSDVAILLIALHSVMYIFRPQSGLYPYRHLAYMVFYLFPVTTACLAFIDGPGYENVGHYCYLRTDNVWSRLALSWVPRYIICASIVGIYLFIYLYIRKRMDDYGRRSSGSLEATAPPGSIRAEPHSPPRVPRIAYHGLIPSTPSSHRTSTTETIYQSKSRQTSASSVSTMRLESAGKILESPIITITTPSSPPRRPSDLQKRRRSIRWSWEGFNQAPASSRTRNILAEETQDPLSVEGPSPPPTLLPIALPLPTAIRAAARRKSLSTAASADETPCSSAPPASPSLFYDRSVPSDCFTHPSSTDATNNPTLDQQERQKRSFSLPNIFTILRRGPSQRGSGTASSLSGGGQDALHTASTGFAPPVRFSPWTFEDTSGSVSRHRDKIRRQLWSLFVYPLVYMFVWTFPFISHVMGYDDSVLSNDPQWLLVLGILSLSVQGMADCFVFTIREQPWRHAKGRGFWSSLKKRWWFGPSGSGKGTRRGGVSRGRTREEILVDGRLARERRAEEVAVERERTRRVQAINGAGSQQQEVERGLGERRNTTAAREWWDTGVYALDLEDRDEDDEEGRERDDEEDGGLWVSGGSGRARLERLEGQRVPV